MTTIMHLHNSPNLLRLGMLGLLIGLTPLVAEARRDLDTNNQVQRNHERAKPAQRQHPSGSKRSFDQAKPAPRPNTQIREARQRDTSFIHNNSAPRPVLPGEQKHHKQWPNKAPRPTHPQRDERRRASNTDLDTNRANRSPRQVLPGEQDHGKRWPNKPSPAKKREQGDSDLDTERHRDRRDDRGNERRGDHAPRTDSGQHDRQAPRTDRRDHTNTDRRRSEPTNQNRNSDHRSRSSHDRHYKQYVVKHHRDKHHRHETYRYHTHYLAPIRHHYHPIGFRLTVLPRSYVRIVVLGLPYFYFGGVFYHHHNSGYVVVRAPIGAIVHELPIGFIAFSIGAFTYYHVNSTYYIWDDEREAYVVVDKPRGAETALAKATEGRLVVYPKQGQSEELQSKDRYACHRWAVTESRVDPTLEESSDLTREEKNHYRRAISACLEGRGYTVK